MQIALIWAWRHLDPGTLRMWFGRQLDASWDVLELLTVLLPPRTALFSVIEPGTLRSLAEMFGLEDLYSRLGPLLDSPNSGSAPLDTEHRERILVELHAHRQRTARRPSVTIEATGSTPCSLHRSAPTWRGPSGLSTNWPWSRLLCDLHSASPNLSPVPFLPGSHRLSPGCLRDPQMTKNEAIQDQKPRKMKSGIFYTTRVKRAWLTGIT
jgi:hypothetical protein